MDAVLPGYCLCFSALSEWGMPEHASVRRPLEVCPDHFSSIQGAVNAANPGDTIKVCAGVYHEQVTIDKHLTLEAEAPRKAEIKAPVLGAPRGSKRLSGSTARRASR